MSSTRDLIRELVRLGVGMEVKNGRPALTLPEGRAARRKARAAAESHLEAIRADAAGVVALWPEVAAEVAAEPLVLVCKECKSLVLDPEQGSVSRWTFCEYPSCPYRTDDAARAFKNSEYQQRRLAEGRRAKALADDPTLSDPIPE